MWEWDGKGGKEGVQKAGEAVRGNGYTHYLDCSDTSWVNNNNKKKLSKLYTVYMCSLLNVSYASVVGFVKDQKRI